MAGCIKIESDPRECLVPDEGGGGGGRKKCPIRRAEEEFKYAAVCAIGIKLTVGNGIPFDPVTTPATLRIRALGARLKIPSMPLERKRSRGMTSPIG